MSFPAIRRFKRCFLWNVVLGAKSQRTVLTPSTASANVDEAPSSHIHVGGRELRNMWACGARKGRRRWTEKFLFWRKRFLFMKIRTIHRYPLPPHSESRRRFVFDNDCEFGLLRKCIQSLVLGFQETWVIYFIKERAISTYFCIFPSTRREILRIFHTRQGFTELNENDMSLLIKHS